MKPLLRLLAGLALTGAALSAATPDSNPGLSLLPRSFQKSPHVDFNVITEMTKEGRLVPAASPAAPVYYLNQPGGFIQRGLGAPAGEKPPTVARMEKAMTAALAQNGYLPATPEHPPTLVVVYSWGSHSGLQADNVSDPDSPNTDTVSNRAKIDDMIERARLVGGEKFASGLIQAMAQAGSAKEATYKPHTVEGGPDAQPNIMGDGAGAMTQIFNPIDRFRRSSDKNTGLMEDVATSVYFVIASAFDFASARTPNKVLFWRTKMTANSAGISMPETLPALILAAGPYFGKDMPEVEVIGQKINREGTVRLAPLEVKGYGDDAQSVPGAPAKAEPKP